MRSTWYWFIRFFLIVITTISCVATNTHGKARGHLTLTGTAGLAVFDSPAMGVEKDCYNISWSVNSHAAISEYRLFYRPQPRHRKSHHQLPSDLYGNGTATKLATSSRNDWNSVVLLGDGISSLQMAAPPPYPGVTRQKMSHVIKQLKPASTYEARVQARNSHGWNKLSPIFHFTTKSIGEIFLFKMII